MILHFEPRVRRSYKLTLQLHANVEERRRLAANPYTSRGILQLLAEDQDVSVRRATARNPGVDSKALSKLARDKDMRTRFWA